MNVQESLEEEINSAFEILTVQLNQHFVYT